MAIVYGRKRKMNQKTLELLKAEYKKIFKDVYEAGGGYGFRYQHAIRVLTYCQKFLKIPRLKKRKINRDALFIAAIYHDAGKMRAVDQDSKLIYGKYGGRSHEAIGAEIVSKYISKYIKDKKLVKLVEKIIREQEPGVKPTMVESKLLKDADRLDNAGLLHIWRSITYANYEKKNLEGLGEFWRSKEGRMHDLECLKKYHFREIQKVAIKRFKKLDKLIKELFIEAEGKDLSF